MWNDQDARMLAMHYKVRLKQPRATHLTFVREVLAKSVILFLVVCIVTFSEAKIRAADDRFFQNRDASAFHAKRLWLRALVSTKDDDRSERAQSQELQTLLTAALLAAPHDKDLAADVLSWVAWEGLYFGIDTMDPVYSELQRFVDSTQSPGSIRAGSECGELLAALFVNIFEGAGDDEKKLMRLSVGQRDVRDICCSMALALQSSNKFALQYLVVSTKGECQRFAAELLNEVDPENGMTIFLTLLPLNQPQHLCELEKKLLQAVSMTRWKLYEPSVPEGMMLDDITIPRARETALLNFVDMQLTQLRLDLLQINDGSDLLSLMLGQMKKLLKRGDELAANQDVSREDNPIRVLLLLSGLRLEFDSSASSLQIVAGIAFIGKTFEECGEYCDAHKIDISGIKAIQKMVGKAVQTIHRSNESNFSEVANRELGNGDLSFAEFEQKMLEKMRSEVGQLQPSADQIVDKAAESIKAALGDAIRDCP